MISPKVYISVLNWMNYQDTIKCLKSLSVLDYDNYEIVVVDNNSPNDSVARIRSAFPTILVVENKENNGYASGHRVALELVKENSFDLIWVLNNDIEVKKGTLSKLVSAYQANGEGIYGSVSLSVNGNVLFGGGESPEQANSFVYNKYKGVPYSELSNLPIVREVQSIEGSSFIVSLSAIKKFGFMSETYFMYVEEADYCYYMRGRGIKSYIVTDSVIVHKDAASFQSELDLSFIASYYRRRNHLFFLKKYYGKTNVEIIKEYGGCFMIFKFFVKYFLSVKEVKKEMQQLFFINLGTIHAIFGKNGKRVSPEMFLL